MKLLSPFLAKSGRAIEVGCGSARLPCRVGYAAPLSLTAFDSEPAGLQVAKATARAFGVKIEPVQGDVRALPFADDSFDLILSGGLLEHFEDPMLVLREMVRMIRPGGTFYADVVPRQMSLYRHGEARRMQQSPWLAPSVYEFSFGPSDYAPWLSELGGQNGRLTSCGVYPNFIGHRLRSGLRRAVSGSLVPLDGGPIAARWGWYFAIVGRKRSS